MRKLQVTVNTDTNPVVIWQGYRVFFGVVDLVLPIVAPKTAFKVWRYLNQNFQAPKPPHKPEIRYDIER